MIQYRFPHEKWFSDPATILIFYHGKPVTWKIIVSLFKLQKTCPKKPSLHRSLFFAVCEEIPETQPTWACFRGIKHNHQNIWKENNRDCFSLLSFCYLTPRCLRPVKVAQSIKHCKPCPLCPTWTFVSASKVKQKTWKFNDPPITGRAAHQTL